MNSVFNLFGWLKVSNRPKHLKAGIVILVLWLICTQVLTSMTILQSSFTGLICVLVAMCSVEYIQKTSGGVWDWLDVIAGVLIPVIVTLIFLFWNLWSL